MENHSEIFQQIVEKRRSYRMFDSAQSIPNDVIKRSLERAILAPNSSNMQLWEFYRIKTKEVLEEVAEICLGQSGATSASEIVVFVTRADLWKERVAVHLERIKNTKAQGGKANDKDRLFEGGEMKYYGELIPFFYNDSFGFLKDIFKRIFVWYKGRKAPFMQDITSKYIPVVVHKSTALAAQTFMLSIAAEGYDSLPMEGLDSKRLKKLLKLPKGAEINMAVAVGKGVPIGLKGQRFRLEYKEVVFEV